MTLKHFPWVYYMIICHVGPPWGHSGTHGGPKMAQNSTKMAQNITKIALHGPKCPYMTLNGPKTLAMGILHKILSYWATLGPLQRPMGASKTVP